MSNQDCPSIFVNLSPKELEGKRYLLAFRKEDGSLSKVVVVESCSTVNGGAEHVWSAMVDKVVKPNSRKNLSVTQHLSMVTEAFEACSRVLDNDNSCAGQASKFLSKPQGQVGSSQATGGGYVVMADLVSEDTMNVVVKEMRKMGALLLATIPLRMDEEGKKGLLLGVIQEAHARGGEAMSKSRHLRRLEKENERLTDQLDQAIRHKSQVHSTHMTGFLVTSADVCLE
ncbi:unnamed protein product [Discosporangium mesarthrocarpum]